MNVNMGIMGAAKKQDNNSRTQIESNTIPLSSAATTPADMSTSSQDCHQLRDQLHKCQQELKLQQARSRQLVAACQARLVEKQAEMDGWRAGRERQLFHLAQQLEVLQARLRRDQKHALTGRAEREQLIAQQLQQLDRLRRHNRRLLNTVGRLSVPCMRCGAKPDSGISDCDDEAQQQQQEDSSTIDTTPQPLPVIQSTATVVAGIMKTRDTDQQRRRHDSNTTTTAASSHITADTADSASTTAVRAKTVTFRLQEPGSSSISSSPQLSRSMSAPEMKAAPQNSLRRLSLGSALSGAKASGPDLVPVLRRSNSAGAARLSVIPEMSDEVSAAEQPARNAPRCRSNIDLIITPHESQEASHLRNNFEEFHFDDEEDVEEFETEDSAGGLSISSEDSGSDRSTDSGGQQRNTSSHDSTNKPASANRQFGSVASSGARPKNGSGKYDKFLEQSGLSQKPIGHDIIPSESTTDHHRVNLKPKDVKLRHFRAKSALLQNCSSNGSQISPTSLRYISEQL